MLDMNFNEWIEIKHGIRRKVFPPGEQMMSILIDFKEGAIGDEHAHPHEQLGFVVSGKVEMIINGNLHDFAAGQQIHIQGNARHSIRALEDSVVLEIFTPIREDIIASLTK
jgi:quercetin dioxygenase-like cupin family protein